MTEEEIKQLVLQWLQAGGREEIKASKRDAIDNNILQQRIKDKLQNLKFPIVSDAGKILKKND